MQLIIDRDGTCRSSGLTLSSILVVSLISHPLPVKARDWRITPSFSARQSYSDNIALDASGNRNDAFITQLNPGFRLKREGSRSTFDLNYRLQTIYYEGYDRDPSVNNQLQMTSKTELVDDSIFVDSTSSIGQTNTSSNGRYNYDNTLASGNTTEFRTFRLSPYWRPHLGRYADGEVRIAYATFSTDQGGDSGISDSNTIQEYANFRNGDATLPFGWRVNFSNQDQYRSQSASSVNANSNDVSFRNYNGELSYRLTTEYSVFIQAGMYDNNFPGPNSTSRSRNGSYYTAGAGWTPSPKFSLSAGYGKNNYFAFLRWTPSQRTTLNVQVRQSRVGGSPYSSGIGSQNYGGGLGTGYLGGPGGYSSPYGQLGGGNTGTTWNGVLQHRMRNTTVSGTYNVSTTTIQQVLQDQQVFSTPGMNGTDTNSDPVVNLRDNSLSSLTDDVITRKRAQLAVSHSFSKNTLTLSGYQENRTYSSGLNEQDVLGLTATWNWRFTQLTSSTLQGSWQQTDTVTESATSGQQKNEYFNIGWILNRRITSHLNGALELRHFQQDGALGVTNNTSLGKSTENRVTASVNVTF
ncbi:TIGR03016 family PEP-CTERM system-associated outer membrane protein [Methylococcus sp. EFPC2]|uniref:TIGR03016 family PEP-CTERM system-associated outer membrane protein n=1 Tax=Methylococcus sp. EFPC2 TaxID=2812648 RepID=UPI001966F177|nr:TIGR03016 family PEP-CTERM system-associated outer membrane protein [Methylococcus sp. EFPC2]QSA98014.1 TIGR03016 family PEP-CTERM system-associated outer membrane protein [Methylococcus sp. EFPC2]